MDAAAVTGAAALTVIILSGLNELDGIASEWNALVFSLAGRSPMLSHAWVTSYLERRPRNGERWVCLAAFANDRLVGILPVSIEEAEVWGKSVTMIRQPRDPHLHSVDVVTAPGYERAVVASFREALDEVAPGWFGLEFSKLDGGSPLVSPECGVPRSSVVRVVEGGASVVETKGKWEEYQRGLSSNFRRQLKRARNKAAEFGSLDAEFWTGSAADPAQLDRFMRVEAAGWKGRVGSAIREDDGLVGFYRRLVERLSQCGALEWHFLRVDDETVAGHLAIRSGRVLSIWKIGFDEAYAHCSPGVLLLEKVLARAFADESVDEVNLVTDKDWHRSWQPQRRPYYLVRLYPTRPWPYLAGALPLQTRQVLRRVPGLRRAVVAVREWRARGAQEKRSTAGNAGE